MTEVTKLIKEYSKAIMEGDAAIFAGAGLSRSSGFVDWKGLLRPLADDLHLDIDQETDLLSVAQYYRNKEKSRAVIDQTIINAFTKEAKPNENIALLSKMPIDTYWTTNYDKEIEKALEAAGKKADVKSEKGQFSTSVPDSDVLVYKMHGDVSNPSEAVLIKEDYENYDKKRGIFREKLKGDLVSKTFLFIGFSFDDPNLEYILARIRSLLDENPRPHYCIERRKNRADYKTDEAYSYALTKQDLKAGDLLRYGIHTVFIDKWSDITKILKAVTRSVKAQNIFISGSAKSYDPWNKNDAEELAREMSYKLVRKGYKITSGFGLGIGSSVISGALKAIEEEKFKHTDEHLCLRPFPQNIVDADERKRVFTKYREDMIGPSGISVFLFGNKEDPTDATKVLLANGCEQEWKIAENNGDSIIPLGSTGYVAKEIFNEAKKNIDTYSYLKPHIPQLETMTDIDKLSDLTVQIVDEINDKIITNWKDIK